jgi:Icc-related predicted phosphoesterase
VEGLSLPLCFFATDLHGRIERYERLFGLIAAERPAAVFLGGDLLPRSSYYASQAGHGQGDFVADHLLPGMERVREILGEDYPAVFLILGNDDPRSEEPSFLEAAKNGTWQYIHGRKATFAGFYLFGYACVPPTPFLLKDWERYDVSRYVDPGCVSPEEGLRSVPADTDEVKWGTIAQDLATLVNDDPMERAICLIHAPPYDTPLDRAALDGKKHEQVPLDVHVGSIAVQRFIEQRQPLLTLHGHVHESTRLTGTWKANIGRTVCINAAHDGPELALVRFDPESPAQASRELI